MTTAERKASLERTLDRYVLELELGDCKPSYDIGDQKVDWTEYRKNLQQWIKDTQELIDTIGDDEGGIVEEITQYCT